MATHQEYQPSPPSSRSRAALRPGSYHIGESVGRVSAVLNGEEPEVDCGGATALGRRGTNEDQFFGAKVSLGVNALFGSTKAGRGPAESQGWLVAVADGMGGVPCGALASRLAIDTFVERATSRFPLGRNASMSPLALQQFGDSTIGACQRALASEVQRTGAGSLPGTTLTAGIIAWPYLYLFHVGDSRCYLQRGIEFQQLTHDHTVYAEIIRAGLPAEGAPPSSRSLQMDGPASNRAGERAAGSATVDTCVIKLSPGDTLLFCTDGITGPLSNESINAVLSKATSEPAQQVAERLVQNALNYGGTDNATAVVVKL